MKKVFYPCFMLFVLLTCLAVASAAPTARVVRVATAPSIDGKLSDRAWAEASNAGAKVVVDNHYTKHRVIDLKNVAYLAYDDENLYVGMVNYVSDTEKINTTSSSWGSVEGVEVCFKNKDGVVFAIHGFPSGKNAITVPSGSAKVDATAVTTAAGIGDSYWTIEYAISLKAFGIDTSKDMQFNLGGFKADRRDWVAWIGTGSSNFNVHDAGIVQFAD